jgi:hypothetical protein
MFCRPQLVRAFSIGIKKHIFEREIKTSLAKLERMA